MKASRVIIVALFLLIGSLGVVMALRPSVNPVGTAGPFRFWDWADCGRPVAEQAGGACDPAPIDASLTGDARAHARFLRAIGLMSFGRLVAAKAELSEALAENRLDLKARVLRARIYMGELDDGAALQDLLTGLRFAPDDPDLLLNYAYMTVCCNPHRAIDIADAYLAHTPNTPDAYYVRSFAHEVLEQYAEAKADLDNALKLEPHEMRATVNRARIELLLGQYDAVIADTSGELGTSSAASAYRFRGLAKAALHDDAGALEDFTNSLAATGEVGPNVLGIQNDTALVRLLVLVRLGKKDEAAAFLDRLLKEGGQRFVLKLQLTLRSAGAAVPLDGKWSDDLRRAAEACFLDNACATATAQRQA